MVIICFEEQSTQKKVYEYKAYVTSPEVMHIDEAKWQQYYCILIEKDYFEQEYKKYSSSVPFFNETSFLVCQDILKFLNMFAFEYSKEMANSEITLDAQATLLTHWMIRSILGESYDMRCVASNYEIAQAEQYIERHFGESLTVEGLAQLVHMSTSTFNRRFKKEKGISPLEYIIEVRIQKAKKLLRRKEVPIVEVALRCGFGSSAYFATSFHKLTKLTPSEYRSNYVD